MSVSPDGYYPTNHSSIDYGPIDYGPTDYGPTDYADASHIAQIHQLTDALREREREIENLLLALSNSRRIGAAVGVLMTTRRLTFDAAFDALSECSRAANVTAKVVARYVTENGVLPAAAIEVQ